MSLLIATFSAIAFYLLRVVAPFMVMPSVLRSGVMVGCLLVLIFALTIVAARRKMVDKTICSPAFVKTHQDYARSACRTIQALDKYRLSTHCRHSPLRHKAAMADAHQYLRGTLQRIVDGGDLTTAELDAAVPDPSILSRVKKDAWEELSHWADDDDIRAKDKRYAANKRDQMRDHIIALSA